MQAHKIPKTERPVWTHSEPKPLIEETKKYFGFSTTKAVVCTSLTILLLGGLFWRLCLSELLSNPNNDGVLRMLNTSGYRLVLNVVLWAASILAGVGYIFFFMPHVWHWLHSHIDTKESIKSDFQKCEPYQRIKTFTLNFWLSAFLFAFCLLVIMG